MSSRVQRLPVVSGVGAHKAPVSVTSLIAVLLLALIGLFAAMSAARAEEGYLDPEQAFAFSADMVDPNTVEVRFAIAPGYYMYRDRLHVTVVPPADAELGAPQFPEGIVKYDPTFEQNMTVYHDRLPVRMPIVRGAGPITLNVNSQGCADAGLCYPPMDSRVTLTPAAGGYEISTESRAQFEKTQRAASSQAAGSSRFGNLLNAGDIGLADAIGGLGIWQTAGVFFVLGLLLALTPCVLPMIPIVSAIVVGASGRSDSGVASPSRVRGFGLAAAYVVGMSVVYTALGVAAGLSGVGLAAWLQTPWVLTLFAVLLALLALAMFGAFTFQMPGGAQARLSALAAKIPGGRVTSAIIMGAISALIVGPCVAAPLAGALLYISQTGDVVLGGAALFAMAWGMGVPLLVVGAASQAWLPRVGQWMNGVSRLFGVLLLATAWWMVQPIVPTWLMMSGWALLALVSAVMLRAFDALPPQAGTARMFGKGLGLLFALAGMALAVGVASGGRDVLRPLAHFAQGGAWVGVSDGAYAPASGPSGDGAVAGSNGNVSAAEFGTGGPGNGSTSTGNAGNANAGTGNAGNANGNAVTGTGGLQALGLSGRTSGAQPPGAALAASGVPNQGPAVRPGKTAFTRVKTSADLDAILAHADRPVMLDFYADWCVSCHEMERFTFGDPAVAARLRGFQLVQADVTANDPEDRALLKRFKLFGPPGIMFFDPKGEYLVDARVIGFQDAKRFAAVLDRVTNR